MNDKESAELARLECEVRELERVLVQRQKTAGQGR